MSTAIPLHIDMEAFQILRTYISQHYDIHVGDQKTHLIDSKLFQLFKENNCQDFHEFHQKAQADTTGKLRDRILEAMTIHETSWFRDPPLWRALEVGVLPALIRKLQNNKTSTLRAWSTACSTGQEIYSYRILIEHILNSQGLSESIDHSQFETLGTDISPKALFFAIAGKYDRLGMARGLSPLYREYFHEVDSIFTLDKKIRDSVIFKKFNLQNDFNPLGKFDIIFFRNVGIYFSEEMKKDVFPRLAEALNPQGYLILSPSESPLKYCEGFTPDNTDNPMYYQLK